MASAQVMQSGAVLGSNCQAPHYCAYTGVDVIPAGTPPILYNSDGTNNNATVFDTTFLTHTNWDGTTFSNAGYLSPITRLTDVNTMSNCSDFYAAGEGGAPRAVVNANSSLVGLTCSGGEYFGLFNTSGSNKGHFTQLHGVFPCSGVNCGKFITQDLCVSGCTHGSSTVAMNFGTSQFSYNDLTSGGTSLLFVYGTNADLTTPTTVTAYSISTSTGAYSNLGNIADMKFGMPQNNAAAWITATAYPWGAFVTHQLTAGEMATGGVWTSGHAYAAGDIILAGVCAYVNELASTAGATPPAFITTSPCKTQNKTDSSGNVWHGLSNGGVFLYQNTGVAATSGGTFTVAGHPDLLSTVSDGTITWTNVGPSYVPVQGNTYWSSLPSNSDDATYNISGTLYPSKYAEGWSTNTYGCGTGSCSAKGYHVLTGGQQTGTDVTYYDATANLYEHLETLTGIMTKYPCTSGSGATCVVGTPVTLGGPSPNPLTASTCPYMLHDTTMNKDAAHPFSLVTEGGGYFGSGCPAFPYLVLNWDAASYNATTSLQVSYAGFNHGNLDRDVFFGITGQGCGGANTGCFDNIYNLQTGVSNQSSISTSLYLVPSATPTGPPNPQCNSVSGNPSCNLGATLDSHLDCLGGCDHGVHMACGYAYNYANLGPAFNAWQNMGICVPTATTYPVTSLPGTSVGPVYQFAHSWNTATASFNTQFGISNWSQDGNWMFISTDYAGCLGANSGLSPPTVWASGTYNQKLMATQNNSPCSTVVSLSGFPWASAAAYTANNVINPIEGTQGSGGVDDVFQALTSGTSGPQSSLSTKQPKCGTTSCFANTNAPTVGTINISSINGTGGTVTLASSVTVRQNVYVTLAGTTGGTFDGTYLVTSTTTSTTIPLTGLSAGTQVGAAGTFAAQGDRVCDLTTPGADSFNPVPPYASSCSPGVVWQDLGGNTQRGDVIAIDLGNQH